MGHTRNAVAIIAMTWITAFGFASSASAFEGGGRKPSEAPLIAVGQHYNGQLTNHKDDANFGGYDQVAIWRLPPLSTRDVIYVDWHSVPSTGNSSYFPVCLVFGQGIDDFNWGTRFDEVTSSQCEGGTGAYRLSGSGTARTAITMQETSVNSSYLEFYTYAGTTEPSHYEALPYDFSLEPPLHFLGLSMRPAKRVSASGIVRATATLATGLPAPDGLPFNLAVTWPGGGVASYASVSSGGVVSFQLALPETAYGEQATFVASHPADGTYQGVSSPKLQAKVAKPKAPPPTPCFLAERRELSIAKQFKRLKRHAARANGVTRRILRRRARRAKHQLREARLKAESLCGPG